MKRIFRNIFALKTASPYQMLFKISLIIKWNEFKFDVLAFCSVQKFHLLCIVLNPLLHIFSDAALHSNM